MAAPQSGQQAMDQTLAQVRGAEDPIDLWLLLGPLLAALRAEDARTRQLRAELYRTLDNVFPAALGTALPPVDGYPRA